MRARRLNAKYAALSRKVKAIELAKVSTVSVPSEPIRELICVVCDSNQHETADYPSIPVLGRLCKVRPMPLMPITSQDLAKEE